MRCRTKKKALEIGIAKGQNVYFDHSRAFPWVVTNHGWSNPDFYNWILIWLAPDLMANGQSNAHLGE